MQVLVGWAAAAAVTMMTTNSVAARSWKRTGSTIASRRPPRRKGCGALKAGHQQQKQQQHQQQQQRLYFASSLELLRPVAAKLHLRWQDDGGGRRCGDHLCCCCYCCCASSTSTAAAAAAARPLCSRRNRRGGSHRTRPLFSTKGFRAGARGGCPASRAAPTPCHLRFSSSGVELDTLAPRIVFGAAFPMSGLAQPPRERLWSRRGPGCYDAGSVSAGVLGEGKKKTLPVRAKSKRRYVCCSSPCSPHFPRFYFAVPLTHVERAGQRRLIKMAILKSLGLWACLAAGSTGLAVVEGTNS